MPLHSRPAILQPWHDSYGWNFPGGFYHLTARGNAQAAIYKDDEDRKPFLDLPGREIARQGWLDGDGSAVNLAAKGGKAVQCQAMALLACKRIARTLFTVQGDNMVLLHGFIKKSEKRPREDLQLAGDRKAKLEK